jgi:hypothetical protein
MASGARTSPWALAHARSSSDAEPSGGGTRLAEAPGPCPASSVPAPPESVEKRVVPVSPMERPQRERGDAGVEHQAPVRVA